jgi:hypothetical protein
MGLIRRAARPAGLATALVLALWTAEPARAVTSIPTAAGPVWDVCDDTGGCGAEADTGAILTGGGGGGDAAFATFGQLEVFITGPVCCIPVVVSGLGLAYDGGRRWTTTTPVQAGLLRVSRTLFAPAGTSHLRYVDTYTNLGPTTEFVAATMIGTLAAGADSLVQVRAGTPGVPVPFFPTFFAADRWFAFRDGALPPDPLNNSVGLATHGLAARRSTSSVFADAAGSVAIQNGFELRPGESVSLATFLVLGPPAGYGATLAETIALAGGPDFADLSVAEKAALGNWGVPQRIATGPVTGGAPHVRLWDVEPATGAVSEFTGFFALDPAFLGGVTLAARGTGLLVGPGPGSAPEVRLFQQDETTGAIGPLDGFFSGLAYSPLFTGGVFVACDSQDSRCDDGAVVGAGAGGQAHVRVFDDDLTEEGLGFLAYEPSFQGGVRVAAGDFDLDDRDEIVVGPGPGGGPHVRVLARGSSNRTVRPVAEFLAFAPTFLGGVSVAVGDVDGDTVPEVIVGAGPGGGPHVRIFKVDVQAGTVSPLGGGFFPYAPGFTGGVQVAVADVDGTGRAEIVTGAGPGGGSHVRMWRVAPGTGAVTELGPPGFFALPPGFAGGVNVAGGFFR